MKERIATGIGLSVRSSIRTISSAPSFERSLGSSPRAYIEPNARIGKGISRVFSSTRTQSKPEGINTPRIKPVTSSEHSSYIKRQPDGIIRSHRRRPVGAYKETHKAHAASIESTKNPIASTIATPEIKTPRVTKPITLRHNRTSGERAMNMLYILDKKRKQEQASYLQKTTNADNFHLPIASKIKDSKIQNSLSKPGQGFETIRRRVQEPEEPEDQKEEVTSALVAKVKVPDNTYKLIKYKTLVVDNLIGVREKTPTLASVKTNPKPDIFNPKKTDALHQTEQVTVFAVGMIKINKENINREVGKEKDEFAVDWDTNLTRLSALAKIKKAIEKIKIGRIASGKEIADSFSKQSDPTLISEIVRDKGKDGSLEALKRELNRVEKVISLDYIRSIIRSLTAVKYAKERQERATSAEVGLVFSGKNSTSSKE